MAYMRDLLIQAGLTLRDGKIEIPFWCKRVKIDVGLSYNAPQASHWIASDPNLIVFGFEPVKENLIKLKHKFYQHYADETQIGQREQFFIIPVALGKVFEPELTNMWVTENDTGCSSTLAPKVFKVKNTQIVPLFSLAHFLEFFPFDSIPFIDHIKTDVQGTDVDVVRGIGRFLPKVLAITSEIESRQYVDSGNKRHYIEKILKKDSFVRLESRSAQDLKLISYVEDPTWINARKYRDTKRRDLYLFQKG